MISDIKTFILESLGDQQKQILRLMERAHRASVPETALLDFALETVVTALRDFRDGRIDWQEAKRLYWVVCRVESECDLAVLDAANHHNYDWHMAALCVQVSLDREVSP